MLQDLAQESARVRSLRGPSKRCSGGCTWRQRPASLNTTRSATWRSNPDDSNRDSAPNGCRRQDQSSLHNFYLTVWLTVCRPNIIVNLMVERSAHLDRVFRALGDPTRRAMLRRLAARERTVGDLAEPFKMSLAAASKNLKKLRHSWAGGWH